MLAAMQGQLPTSGSNSQSKGRKLTQLSDNTVVYTPLWFAPMTASQMYVYPQQSFCAKISATADGFDAPTSDNITLNNLAHFANTHDFWKTAKMAVKNPWYDSYADYASDIRYLAQDHSVVPEFRISEHMDHYITKGFSFNNRFLTLEGASIASASAATPGAAYNDNFFKVYSHSDFMKHFAKINNDYKEVAAPAEMTLRCHGVKKLLPYQGFYPMLRCMQLGTLFSSSYAPFISGSNLSLIHI